MIKRPYGPQRSEASQPKQNRKSHGIRAMSEPAISVAEREAEAAQRVVRASEERLRRFASSRAAQPSVAPPPPEAPARRGPFAVDGPFAVGFADLQLAGEGTPGMRVLYPTRARGDAAYLPLGDVQGRAYYTSAAPGALKKWTWMFAHVGWMRLPAAEWAPPLRSASGRGWPLVILSHGNCAGREVYAALSLQLVSRGYVVAIADHEDGSAALARRADGSTLPHDRSIYELQGAEYVEARRRGAARRAAELLCTRRALERLCAGQLRSGGLDLAPFVGLWDACASAVVRTGPPTRAVALHTARGPPRVTARLLPRGAGRPSSQP